MHITLITLTILIIIIIKEIIIQPDRQIDIFRIKYSIYKNTS